MPWTRRLQRIGVLVGIGAVLISGELYAFAALNRGLAGLGNVFVKTVEVMTVPVMVLSAASKLMPEHDAANGKSQEDAVQAESLRRYLQEHYAADIRDPDLKTTARYGAAYVHLRDDDRQQIIVYLIGHWWCGTGGCPMLILAPEKSSFTVVTEISIVHPPIRVLRTRSHAWHDLGVWVQGGGIQPGYEARLSFDGKEYPENPTEARAQRLTAAGKVVVSRSDKGDLLYSSP